MTKTIDFIFKPIEEEEKVLNLLLDDFQKQDFYSASQKQIQLGYYTDAIGILKSLNKYDEAIKLAREKGLEGDALKLELEYLRKLEKSNQYNKAGYISNRLGFETRAIKNFNLGSRI